MQNKDQYKRECYNSNDIKMGRVWADRGRGVRVGIWDGEKLLLKRME